MPAPGRLRPLVVRERFDPRSIGALHAWWAADRLGYPVADGATVATWRDLSGNGRDASQATAGSRPTYRTGRAGGRPALVFDGGDYLDSSWTAITQPITIVSVNTFPASVGDVYDGSSGASNRTAFWCENGSAIYIYAGGSSLNSTVTAPQPLSVYVNEFNGSSSSVRQNSTVKVTGNPGTTGSAGLRIGHESSLFGSYGFDGDIAEILVYAKALTAAEKRRLEVHLGAKYGIVQANA